LIGDGDDHRHPARCSIHRSMRPTRPAENTRSRRLSENGRQSAIQEEVRPWQGRSNAGHTNENVGRPTFTSYICQVPQDQDFRATSGAARYLRVPP
jgi:hypothetical protein